MILYVVDGILQVAVPLCKVDLKQVAKQVLQVRGKVTGKSNLKKERKQVTLNQSEQEGSSHPKAKLDSGVFFKAKIQRSPEKEKK